MVKYAFVIGAAAMAMAALGVTVEDDGETVRVRRDGESVEFAEFRTGERSSNCEIAVRAEKGSPFVFIDVTPKVRRGQALS